MVEVTCPKCGRTRQLSRQAQWRMDVGKSDGTCISCSRLGNKANSGNYKITNPLARSLLRTRFYKIWVGMRARCNNPNTDRYEHYGGRGITVCERWNSFEAFVEDMYPTYKSGLTIERKDVNGNYEPTNCTWATSKQQANNKQNTRYLTYQGRTQSQLDWSKELNIPYGIISGRLNLGWSIDRVLSEPVTTYKSHHKTLEYNGESHSIKEWSEITGLTPHAISSRLHRGWTVERVLSQPI